MEPTGTNDQETPDQVSAEVYPTEPVLLASPLDIDSQEDTDTDSAFDSSSRYTSTASLRTSVYDFVEENGRTYHKFREGKYLLPNDEAEQERLDLQHHLFVLTLHGKLHLAPLKTLKGGVHDVLDIATGTGIWAIELASQFPSASVIGTDLSPIQPGFVPPNCRFEVDDAEDPWLYSHQFDYIHARAVATCFTSHSSVIRSAYAFTRPGGYLELQDGFTPISAVDSSLSGTALEKWGQLVVEGGKKLGKNWGCAAEYKTYMQQAGFVDVQEVRFAWPVGTWARGERMKMLGAWARENFLGALQGISMAVMTRAHGMSQEEVEVFLVDVRKDVMNRNIHAYFPIWVVYGRKPMDDI